MQASNDISQADWGQGEFRPFIVLARSRTGSNFLNSLLKSHSSIAVKGEIFAKIAGRSYVEIVSDAFNRCKPRKQARGFKIFYYHPSDDPTQGVWEALLDWRELHVIHLKRRNILRTLVSRKLAGIQDVWKLQNSEQDKGSNQELVTISFTPSELREGFEQTRQWETWGDETFANHPLASVDYEDLVSDRDTVMSKLTTFLGVSEHEPETTLQKQNNRTLASIIENFDELQTEFRGTEYESFFEDGQ